jgi:hypothetical protein
MANLTTAIQLMKYFLATENSKTFHDSVEFSLQTTKSSIYIDHKNVHIVHTQQQKRRA